jgi:hypothetical protein
VDAEPLSTNPDDPFFNTLSWTAANERWTMRMESQTKTGRRELFAIDEFRRRQKD